MITQSHKSPGQGDARFSFNEILSACLFDEQAVISAISNFPDCIPKVTDIIAVDDLFHENHRRIFSAIVNNYAAGLPVELPALAKILQKQDIEDLTELFDCATTGQTAPHYAREIKKASIARQIQQLGRELQQYPERAEVIIPQLQDLNLSGIKPTRTQFALVTDFLSKPYSLTYLIDNLIERDTTGLLFGPSGGGKTFVALDLFCAIGTGGNIYGHKASRGIVLYLAGEGHGGLRRRVKACQIHHVKSAEDMRLLHISKGTINLEAPGAQAIIAEGRALSEQHGEPVAMIVIDTLARHLDGDENSTRDMGAFIKAVDLIRSGFPGSVALIVHHTGHADDAKGRARGSSALKAGMDFEIYCDKGLLTFTKMKDAETPEPIPFKLRPVEIGTDDNGQAITSCVVEYGQRAEHHQTTGLSDNEKLLFDLIKVHPELSELRIAFYDSRRKQEGDVKADTLKQAYLRSLKNLTLKKLIIVDSEKNIAGHVTERDKA